MGAVNGFGKMGSKPQPLHALALLWSNPAGAVAAGRDG